MATEPGWNRVEIPFRVQGEWVFHDVPRWPNTLDIVESKLNRWTTRNIFGDLAYSSMGTIVQKTPAKSWTWVPDTLLPGHRTALNSPGRHGPIKTTPVAYISLQKEGGDEPKPSTSAVNSSIQPGPKTLKRWFS